MPVRPAGPCNRTGCPARATQGGLCGPHASQQARAYDLRRGTATQRGYGPAWRSTRRAYLRAHPACECPRHQAMPAWRRPAATDVHHLDGLGPHGPRGYDWGNLQALTHACHSSITAREHGWHGQR